MSSEYDPQEYGLVKLDAEAGAAARREGEEKVDSPEDILFEEDPALSSEPFADAGDDADWGTLRDTADYVGSDEAFPLPSETLPTEPPALPPEPEHTLEEPAAVAPPEPVSRSELVPEPALPPEPAVKKARPVSSSKPSGARARLTPRPPRIPAHRISRPHRPSGWLVPFVVFALSAGMGATMFLFFHNMPLAALALAMGVIGSLFTRVLLR